MNIDSKTSPRHWRVEDILGHLNDNVDKNNAEELLHCILTSTDILTWNLQGEIVYKGQNIRGTNIVDLLQYTILPYNTEIPEPAGLNIFLKGLAKLEIDKSLTVNGRVLTMLAHKQPLHDVDTQSDKSADESENVDTTCNSCNKVYISPIWVHALYAHGQIFIPIVQCVTVRSVIFDCPKEMSLL
jgi:hypothetical protein